MGTNEETLSARLWPQSSGRKGDGATIEVCSGRDRPGGGRPIRLGACWLPELVDQARGRHVEVGEELPGVRGGCAAGGHRPAHVAEPGVSLRHADGERVPHPQAWVPAPLAVATGTSP